MDNNEFFDVDQFVGDLERNGMDHAVELEEAAEEE